MNKVITMALAILCVANGAAAKDNPKVKELINEAGILYEHVTALKRLGHPNWEKGNYEYTLTRGRQALEHAKKEYAKGEFGSARHSARMVIKRLWAIGPKGYEAGNYYEERVKEQIVSVESRMKALQQLDYPEKLRDTFENGVKALNNAKATLNSIPDMPAERFHSGNPYLSVRTSARYALNLFSEIKTYKELMQPTISKAAALSQRLYPQSVNTRAEKRIYRRGKTLLDEAKRKQASEPKSAFEKADLALRYFSEIK